MKKVALFFLLFIVISLSTIAQEGYTSNNNSTGFWENGGSWTRTQNWLPATPGVNVGGATNFIDLYGYVARDGDLTLGGGAVLTVYDTLWVLGNLNVSQGSSVSVQTGGVLIVDNNFVASGGTASTNNGNVIVKGNLVSSGSANIQNGAGGMDGFYVYGTSSGMGGATFNGSSDPSSASFRPESEFSNNNPTLYNFVHTTLDVQLVSIDALYDGEKVIISWSTTSALQNDSYEIYRSEGEAPFSYLGEVKGSDIAHSSKEYFFFDNQPVMGTSYYKIKHIAFESRDKFFPPVAVKAIHSSFIFQVFPTVIKTGNIKVKAGSIDQETFRITMHGLKGNLMFDKTFFAKKGIIKELELKGIDRLQNGIYFINMHTENNLYRKKVIVKH